MRDFQRTPARASALAPALATALSLMACVDVQRQVAAVPGVDCTPQTEGWSTCLTDRNIATCEAGVARVSESCRPDEVCVGDDNGNAECHVPIVELTSCGQVMACALRDCPEEFDDDVLCPQRCRADATAIPGAQFGVVATCIEECPGGNAWDYASCFLGDSVCTENFSSCVSGGSGSITCAGIRLCNFQSTSGPAAEGSCLRNGDPWAQVAYFLYQQCVDDTCDGLVGAQRTECAVSSLDAGGDCEEFAADCYVDPAMLRDSQ